MQTAQGETEFNVYAGTVIMDEQRFDIPVLGKDEISEILLGLPWLRTRRLVVDFSAEVLTAIEIKGLRLLASCTCNEAKTFEVSSF